MTLLFGLFSGICIPLQTSESGRLGYIKGMGIWSALSGAIVIIAAIFVIRNVESCIFNPEWVSVAVCGLGVVLHAAGIYMFYTASSKFVKLQANPSSEHV